MVHLSSCAIVHPLVSQSIVGSCEMVGRRHSSIARFFLIPESSVGGLEHRVVLHEPRGLQGKTAWHLQTVVREFFLWFHKIGHYDGINLQFFAFDRAPLSAVARKLRQANALYWEATRADAGDSHVLHELMSWTLFAGCGSHDCHNGALHGLMPFVTYDEQMKDLHIVVASVRNCFSESQSHIG